MRRYTPMGPFSHAPCAKRGILGASLSMYLNRLGPVFRALMLAAGLFLLFFVVDGFLALFTLLLPGRIGSIPGGYRADMTLLVTLLSELLLAFLLLFLWLPRATGMVYDAYALRYFGFFPAEREMQRSAGPACRRIYGAYWALLLCFLAGALIAFWTGVFFGWNTGVALGFLLLQPLCLSMPICIVTEKRGFAALWESVLLTLRFPVSFLFYRLFCAVPAMLLFLLPAEVACLYIGDPLAAAAVSCFLTVLSGCALLPFLAALNTAMYAHFDLRLRKRRLKNAQTKAENCKREALPHMENQVTNTPAASAHWNLADIFPSDESWESAFAKAKAAGEAFPVHAGKLGESSDALFSALADESALSLQLEKLFAYAHMHRDEDNGNVKYQGMTDRVVQLAAEAGAAAAFLTPELLTIPEDTLSLWAAEPRFAPFRFLLSDVSRRRAHTLTAGEERILAMASDPLSGPDNIFTMLSDVDLSFGTVKDASGESVPLTHGTYGKLLESRDRRVRKDAYEGMYAAYRGMRNTVAATYAASVKGDLFSAHARRYGSSLEMALFDNNVPVAVYDQLVEAVHEKLPALQKYLELRKKLLGLSQLEMYDLYVPMVPDMDLPMPYESGKALVREALAPLGEHYQKLLDTAYEGGWMDVYETPGKTSGAFSSGVYGVHPYVLLNYQDRLNDAFTMAHELGHAMHSYFSDGAQPYETSQYSILVAEVASTVNETLLNRYLLEKETDPKKRAYYLNHFCEQFRTTCFRQTMFAEFERESHRMAENGEPLTVESLSEVYRSLNELYYAGAHVDDNIAIEWMRIPHFYNAFYVYQYATGLCSAVKLADDVKKSGDPSRYLNFLSSGGSDYPIEELKAAGVDLTKKDSILSALDVFEQCVDELGELLRDA